MNMGRLLSIFAKLGLVGYLSLWSIAAMGRTTLPMNDGWRMFSSSANSSDNAKYISLPYSWNLDPSTPVSLTMANYIRTINVPMEWYGKRIYLKCHGAQSAAALFVNGRYVGEHRGGATAFLFDISNFLRYGEDNTVFIRVSSAPQNDLLPTSTEHTIYGGVYRSVELIVTPQVAFSPNVYGSDGMHITTRSTEDRVAKGDIALRFTADQTAERALKVWVNDKWGVTVFERKYDKLRIDGKEPLIVPFEITNAELWSPRSPSLYSFHAELSSVIDKNNPLPLQHQADRLSLQSGFRIITLPNPADSINRGLIKINDRPIVMRGVSLYHDHPIDGAAISESSHRQDIETLRDIGANAIRSAISPHSKALYDICDHEGIMVWIDTPLSRAPYLSDVAYFPTDAFRENGLQQLREIIYQNYNHPSVMMWGIFSLLLSTGDDVTPYLKSLNNEAHKIDPMRPTVALSNQNGSINEVSDLITWRQNMGWESGSFSDIEVWKEQLHERWSHFRSAVMFGSSGSVEHQTSRSKFEYENKRARTAWFPEGRQSAQHETYMAALCDDSLFWGVWISSLYDFKAPRSTNGENLSGLIDFQRRNRKDAYYLYRALWRKNQKTLHIADKRNNLIEDSIYTLRVYGSDTIPPRVIQGDDTLYMRYVAPAQFIRDSIKVSSESTLVVQQGYKSDTVRLIYNSPLRAIRR